MQRNVSKFIYFKARQQVFNFLEPDFKIMYLGPPPCMFVKCLGGKKIACHLPSGLENEMKKQLQFRAGHGNEISKKYS